MGHSLDGDDPFSQILAPPINESVEERFERERREAEAKRISDEIDEILRSEKLSSKKRKKPVKVLLLGQSESGELVKIDALRNLPYCPLCFSFLASPTIRQIYYSQKYVLLFLSFPFFRTGCLPIDRLPFPFQTSSLLTLVKHGKTSVHLGAL